MKKISLISTDIEISISKKLYKSANRRKKLEEAISVQFIYH